MAADRLGDACALLPAVPGCGACSRPEGTVPRRRPAGIRADRQARLSISKGPFGRRVSQFPGLSSRGRAVIARLEHTRLRPGQTEEVLWLWRMFLRDPYHRLWDPRYGCGYWECCPDIDEVHAILGIVAHHLPRRDAHRFRRMLAAI